MKMRMKIVVDAAMTVILLLLMAYERIGQAAHEWMGAGCFLLFLLHHLLNRGWHKNLFRGKYTSLRVVLLSRKKLGKAEQLWYNSLQRKSQ